MRAVGRSLEYRRFRAPEEDRTALVVPSWECVPATAAENAARRAASTYDAAGVSLPELAEAARREVVQAALEWTRSYRDDVRLPSPPADGSAVPMFLAGHQPQLVHPGVCFKNFALSALARRHGAVAVNLIVDSDTVKSAELRVPGGSPTSPEAVLMPMDAEGPVIPFEERHILDPAFFASFGDRVVRRIAPLVADPLMRDFWPTVRARAEATGNLGQALAQARHLWERQCGLETLEVPQSRVCRTASFARFSVHLLSELPRFLAAYNAAVGEYRRVHRIRSTSHPAPDLAVEGPWYEAPYWIWTANDPRRRRPFVRFAPDRMVLSDRQGCEIELPWNASGDATAAIDAWTAAAERGVRLRSRALVTTLFARLLLSDVFIHGIGGAKYDQVTDVLIERFFGLPAPGLLVLSATVRLPIPHERTFPDAVRSTDCALRELTFHPERAVGDVSNGDGALAWRELADAKRRWIETPQTPENAHARWEGFRRINASMQPWVASQRDRLLRSRAECIRNRRNAEVLDGREYAFCLYPDESLRDSLLRLLPNDP